MYTQVRKLQSLGVDAHVVCERTQNLDQFRVENIHCLADEPMWVGLWDRGLRLAKLRRHLNYLVKIGMRIAAPIVHSHFGHVGWGNLGAVRKLRASHVVTFYGYDVNLLPTRSPVWRRRYQDLFAEASLILCEGRHMAQCIIGLGCPPNKVSVQHLGVDTDRIEFKPRRLAAKEPLMVLIAASFREKKGIPDAIDAVGRLQQSRAVELTIIGDAGSDKGGQAEKRRILAALERNGLMKRVRLLGYQPHELMLQEAYRHHIFLSPSVTARDGDTEGGAPVSLIEMVASGMPIVSTTHCDIPGIITHGKTGLLAAEHDVDGLVRHLRWYVENPGRWEDMLVAGREYVDLEFGLNAQVGKLMRLYEFILR